MARVGGDELEEEDELDVFAIHHKHATHERLRQWRKATLALNATRRFRYTLNLERTEEARNFPSKKAVKHYQQAGTGEIDGYLPPQGFGVGPRKLQGIVKARELSFLHQLGEGVKEGWYDGTSIACAILAVVLVTAISDYKQSLEFQALNDEKKNIHVQVVRMGQTFRTSIFELVVGDIVPLNIGDQVPADGLLIKGHSLSIDESSLTGESEPVLKDSMHPFLLSGCKVINGHGVMLVVIVVIAVPEGLPLAVTLTLAYSMRKMMADKSLVRNLSACETMGSATIICSDKTGTLTLNEMTVVKAWVAGKFREAIKIRCSNVVGKLIEGIAQNCTGMVSLTKGGDPEVTGSPTEKALLTWGLEANIGLAMGISGTEVAKESSDVIILDDNFASVVKMMRWGRSVYANIQKFIQFQLTVNVAALAINFVAAVSNGSVPLQTVQMLWVNLIMDTLGALALATEPPTDDLMSKPSIGLRDPLVTNVMWRNILGQAAFQVMVLLTLFYKGIDLLHLDGTKERKDIVRNTTIFNTFVFCQLFNEINARKPEEYNIFAGILKNRMFVSVVVISIIFQGIMVESLNKFAKTTNFPGNSGLFPLESDF